MSCEFYLLIFYPPPLTTSLQSQLLEINVNSESALSLSPVINVLYSPNLSDKINLIFSREQIIQD